MCGGPEQGSHFVSSVRILTIQGHSSTIRALVLHSPPRLSSNGVYCTRHNDGETTHAIHAIKAYVPGWNMTGALKQQL